MADWSNPQLTSLYADFMAYLMARDVDAATMAESPTGPPIGFVRWNRTSEIFEMWNGTIWAALVIQAAGGGTGSTTLSLGTMASQNSNAVNISAGIVIAALTAAGVLKFSSHNTHDIGQNAVRPRYIYTGSGLVLPVGTDKWVP